MNSNTEEATLGKIVGCMTAVTLAVLAAAQTLSPGEMCRQPNVFRYIHVIAWQVSLIVPRSAPAKKGEMGFLQQITDLLTNFQKKSCSVILLDDCDSEKCKLGKEMKDGSCCCSLHERHQLLFIGNPVENWFFGSISHSTLYSRTVQAYGGGCCWWIMLLLLLAAIWIIYL